MLMILFPTVIERFDRAALTHTPGVASGPKGEGHHLMVKGMFHQ